MIIYLLVFAFLVITGFILYNLYIIHFNNRFVTISKNRFYRSAAMPPEVLKKYLSKYKIKTVIDLRHGNVKDKLNPESITDVELERRALKNLPDVNHIHIPSKQIPNEENLEAFFEVLDKETSYPVLVHCHHGSGRATIYSAIYRIEYENYTPEKARMHTKFPCWLNSFSLKKPKGKWLNLYAPRREKIIEKQQFKIDSFL